VYKKTKFLVTDYSAYKIYSLFKVSFHNIILICNTNEVENRIGGVMGNMLSSTAADRGFEHRSGQTKDYPIGICCFSAKHAALRRKSKDW